LLSDHSGLSGLAVFARRTIVTVSSGLARRSRWSRWAGIGAVALAFVSLTRLSVLGQHVARYEDLLPHVVGDDRELVHIQAKAVLNFRHFLNYHRDCDETR